jgi:hypothetical protein
MGDFIVEVFLDLLLVSFGAGLGFTLCARIAIRDAEQVLDGTHPILRVDVTDEETARGKG